MKFPISRRTFLRGSGVMLALPWLEAMEKLTAIASTAQPAPRRLAVVYVPNGVHMPEWTPTADGADYQLPRILEPLAQHRRDILVVSRLAAHRADGPSGNHARALAAFLTGRRPPDSGRDLLLGISADQLAAQRIGQRTPLPSLQIGCEPAQQAGQCDNPYSCSYTSCISWSSPTAPLPALCQPRQVFDRLFPIHGVGLAGNGDPRSDRRRSVLDFVREEASQLRTQLSAADRRRIDEYLASVRAVETASRRLEQAVPPAPEMPRRGDAAQDYPTIMRLMCDLLVLAWRTDSTRIATLLFANEFSNRPYPFLEVRDGHHDLSHHGNDPAKHAKLRAINRFHVEQFAYLLEKLQAAREGDETLLDRSMIVYGSGNSDGNRHNHDNLPILVAGRGGGLLRMGRHLRLAREFPLTNLWVSLLDKMGAPVESLGDSTGPLPGLE